jgi:hypothetical protein
MQKKIHELKQKIHRHIKKRYLSQRSITIEYNKNGLKHKILEIFSFSDTKNSKLNYIKSISHS